MLKTIYLDALNCQLKQLKSALKVLYHLIIIQRDGSVAGFRLSLEKNLELQFCEICDEKTSFLVQKQVDNLISKIEEKNLEDFVVVFKIFAENFEERNLLISLIKSKKNATVFEEFSLPVNLSREARSPALVAAALKDRMNKVLLHVQNDQTGINLTHVLKFDLVIKKMNN